MKKYQLSNNTIVLKDLKTSNSLLLSNFNTLNTFFIYSE